jgi:hypothetical protein
MCTLFRTLVNDEIFAVGTGMIYCVHNLMIVGQNCARHFY